ncbi:sodium:proton antiporter [Sphingomonas sp. C3-2]|uniref:cation:proton antiporter n=1 Tax=Sphingomonas sp. C3-2 TaxID=3062169 RepID=UPI00294B2E6E|nr:sodium:proton antiporter [Sphingomonas sp. C3-2]WOK35278.1 sodium:proton antiporter [Sphingomonas sp. C3-2]
MLLDSLMVKIALIGLLGIGAQWIAWRTGRPAIALMLITGVLAGPVLGLIDPKADFGALMEPMVKLAVAVILFEGGLSLNFRDLRHAGGPVLRLVLIGAPLGWALGTAAAYYGAGLSFEVAALFGGILVVTGPTVVQPLLRPLNISPRVKDALKWEAIVNDPIGALLAVFIYAYVTHGGAGRVDIAAIGFDVLASTFVAGLLGAGLGFAIGWLFPRGYVPEYLKTPTLLVTVIAGFVIADLIQHETGLVTVTIMGVVIANQPMAASHALRRFKEDLTVILVSGVFILMSATLDWATMSQFQARFVIFLFLLLFVVRPLTVLTSLLFSAMPWRERIFVAWIAPRGIVAVAITGLFALRLTDYGVQDAEGLIPLSFGVVVATIFAHGFSARWLARRLGIENAERSAVLIVGANGWTAKFGAMLKSLGLAVTIADPSKFALRTARKEGLETWQGDILAEDAQDHLEFGEFQHVIAASDNDAYNALICADIGQEMGPERVSQTHADRTSGSSAMRGRVLLETGATMDELQTLVADDWAFSRTRITEKFRYSDYRAMLPEGAMPVAIMKPDKRILFFSTTARPLVEAGDTAISFVPPDTASRNRSEDLQDKAQDSGSEVLAPSGG